MEKLQEQSNLHDFCKLKNYLELFSEDYENAPDKLKKNPQTVKLNGYSEMKAKKHAYKTRIMEEKNSKNVINFGTIFTIKFGRNVVCLLDEIAITEKSFNNFSNRNRKQAPNYKK